MYDDVNEKYNFNCDTVKNTPHERKKQLETFVICYIIILSYTSVFIKYL